MKRLSPALCAIAVATGAALLFAPPSSAQTYNTYTNNFEAAGNPDAARGYQATGYTITASTSSDYVAHETGTFLFDGDLSAAAGVGGIPSTGYASGKAGDAEWSYLVTTQPVGATALNGAVNWRSGGGASGPYTDPTNNVFQDAVQAHSGTQSVLESFQQNSTTGGFQRYITGGNSANPTVDLAGTVSFWMYVDTGAGDGTDTAPGTTSLNSSSAVDVNIAINQVNTVISASDPNALGQYNTMPAATRSEYVYDSTISGGNYPMGGKQVNAGSWQFVSFDLASDPLAFAGGVTTTPSRTGLGSLFAVNVTPVNPTTGVQANASQVNEVYNVYFDDLTISSPAAAPEPSAWIGLAAGGVMLLGLGLVSARRRRGMTAA